MVETGEEIDKEEVDIGRAGGNRHEEVKLKEFDVSRRTRKRRKEEGRRWSRL